MRISRGAISLIVFLAGLMLSAGVIWTAQAAQIPTKPIPVEPAHSSPGAVFSHTVYLPSTLNRSVEVVVGSLKITPGGVILTAGGDSEQLSATVFEKSGSPLPVQVTWSSNDPAVVTVNSNGLATAVAATGSALLRASYGGKQASILVVVADPVAGAFLLTDAQITSDPLPLDPLAEQGIGYQYTVTLDVPGMPAAGQMVINTGEKPVGGKTITVTGDVLTLEIVALSSLFDAFSLNQHFTTADMIPSVPVSVTQVFNVQASGDTILLSLKPGVVISAVTPVLNQAGPQRPDLSKEFELGPFACEAEAGGVGIELSKAEISFKQNLSADFIWEDEHKLIKVSGQPELKLALTPELKAELAGKLSCELEIYEFIIPTPGVFGWLVAGKIPVGLGFEVEGKVPLASLTKVEITSWQRSEIESGFNCQPDCVRISNFTNTTPATPDGSALSVKFSGPQLEQPKLEASLSAYLFAELNAGAALIKKDTRIAGIVLREFEFLVAQAGFKLEGKFASKEVQAHDPAFNSEYSLSFEAQVSPGETLEKAVEILELKADVNLEWLYSKKLGISPAASVAADRQAFTAGNTLNITVTLVPSSTEFPVIGYNLDSVKVYKKIPGATPDALPTLLPIAQELALPGQLTFHFTFVVTETGTIDQYMAFAEPHLMPFLSLELGIPQAGYDVLILEGVSDVDDMNNKGQMLISYYDRSTFSAYRGIWDNGEIRFIRFGLDPLLYPGGDPDRDMYINDQGLVAGTLFKNIVYESSPGITLTTSAEIAFNWRDNNQNGIIEAAEINELSALSSNPDFKQKERETLRDLNNIGDGTGAALNMYFDTCSVPGSWWHFQFPVLFHPSGAPTNLEHFLPDMCSFPSGEGWALNDQSEVLAVVWNGTHRERYGIRRSDGWLELPQPAGVSYADPVEKPDINNTGMAIGIYRSTTAAGYLGAIWFYSDTLKVITPTIQNMERVFPILLNDAGQVLLEAYDAETNTNAFYLWHDDNSDRDIQAAELRDLNSLLPGGVRIYDILAQDEYGCLAVILSDSFKYALLLPKGRLEP